MADSLVQKQFGVAAADYTASAVHASGPSLARLVALVSPQRNWRALDVATGAGHTAMVLAPHVAGVIASDITGEMLAEAAKLAADRGLANVETAHAEAGALPFAGESFDLVTCRLAAHHFADPTTFVGEVWRVLIPDGTFALVDNIGTDAALLPNAGVAELRDASIVYNAFEKLRDPSHARCLTLAEWRELLEDTGFVDVREERLDQDIAFEPWTKRMRCDAATVAHLQAMLATDGALRAFLRPRDEGGGSVFTLQEAIIVARKPVQLR